MRCLLVLVSSLCLLATLPMRAGSAPPGRSAASGAPRITLRPPPRSPIAGHEVRGGAELSEAEAAALAIPWQQEDAGRIRFDLAPMFQAGPTSVSAASADLNGDGHGDLAIAATDADSLVLVFDAASGPRAPRAGLALPSPAFDVAAADLDGDGRADLACTLHSGAVAVALNRGGGSFAPLATYAIPPDAFGIAAGDLDGDGDQDVAAALRGLDAVCVLLNDGSGALGSPADFAVGDGPVLPIAADVTGDGRADLLTCDFDGRTVSCLVALGGGVLAPARTLAVSTIPYGIAAGDLDGDGDVDLAMSGAERGALLLGDGTGRFEIDPAFAPPGDFWIAGVAVTDTDEDGRPDIVLMEPGATWAGAFASFGVARVWRNLGGGAFGRARGFHTLGGTQMLRLADVDEDGRPDLLAACTPDSYGASGVNLLLARGAGTFASLTEQPTTVPDGVFCFCNTVHSGHAVSLGGQVDDIVFGAGDGAEVRLMRNRGDGDFDPAETFARGRILEVRDLDADGLDDLLLRNADTLEVRRGSAGHAFAPPSQTLAGVLPVALGEFSGDGVTDLALVDATWALLLARGIGDGSFEPPAPTGARLWQDGWIGGYSAHHQVGGALDLDGDGVDELLVFREVASADSITVFDVRPDGSADSIGVLEVPGGGPYAYSRPSRLVRGDFDGDHRPDLLTLTGEGNDVPSYFAVFLNRGDGTLERREYGYAGNEASGASVADLDGDGLDDVLVSLVHSEGTGELHVMASRGDGTFDHGRRNDLGDFLNSVTIGRFDADARPDFAITAARHAYVGVALNASPPPDGPTPVAASLVSASAGPEGATLEWRVDAASLDARVQRSDGGAAWRELARVAPDGEGRVRFSDASAEPGRRYGYRLEIRDGGAPFTTAETWLDIPAAAALALAGATPNPVDGDLVVAFTLAARAPATLALFDLAGRRVASRNVGALGAGPHRVRLAERAALEPGLYFVRLSMGAQALVKAAVVMR